VKIQKWMVGRLASDHEPKKQKGYILDLCVSSLRRGRANLFVSSQFVLVRRLFRPLNTKAFRLLFIPSIMSHFSGSEQAVNRAVK
jgi:hypothetical protein